MSQSYAINLDSAIRNLNCINEELEPFNAIYLFIENLEQMSSQIAYKKGFIALRIKISLGSQNTRTSYSKVQRVWNISFSSSTDVF